MSHEDIETPHHITRIHQRVVNLVNLLLSSCTDISQLLNSFNSCLIAACSSVHEFIRVKKVEMLA